MYIFFVMRRSGVTRVEVVLRPVPCNGPSIFIAKNLPGPVTVETFISFWCL